MEKCNIVVLPISVKEYETETTSSADTCVNCDFRNSCPFPLVDDRHCNNHYYKFITRE